jgi:hypothetical protein
MLGDKYPTMVPAGMQTSRRRARQSGNPETSISGLPKPFVLPRPCVIWSAGGWKRLKYLINISG